MENRQDIAQELHEIGSTIASLRHLNPYQVPAGYFDHLAGSVWAQVDEVALPARQPAAYSVPSGYFEGLASQVLEKLKQDMGDAAGELAETAPLLAGMRRENVYAVPDGYFAGVNFAAKAMRTETPVISLRNARRWMQYAAAAVMAGILVTGAFVFTNNKANLGEPEDVSYEINKVSEADLATYMYNPEHFVAAPATTSLASEADLADVKTDVHTLSDEELNQYLKENADGFEAAATDK